MKLLRWAQANSLWYFPFTSGCCGDELFQAFGARYDLERFGCRRQTDPSQADLLILNGAITTALLPEVKRIYRSMLKPKYVMAVGACAISGGLYAPKWSSNVIPGLHQEMAVDVFIPGCPPRPEAIMNGIITLQKQILMRES